MEGTGPDQNIRHTRQVGNIAWQSARSLHAGKQNERKRLSCEQLFSIQHSSTKSDRIASITTDAPPKCTRTIGWTFLDTSYHHKDNTDLPKNIPWPSTSVTHADPRKQIAKKFRTPSETALWQFPWRYTSAGHQGCQHERACANNRNGGKQTLSIVLC